MEDLATPIIIFVIFIGGVLFCWRALHLEVTFKKREQEMKRKLYELAILKELGERIGYSLNVPSIVDIICGSLSQFIKYSAVAYILLGQEKAIFKIHLEDSVSKQFVKDVKERMLESLAVLLNKKIPKNRIKEVITGAILVEEFAEPVRSFFNIPLVINNKVVGIITVAHTKAGLYKEEDMTILYKITQQASNAVTRLQEVVQTEQRKLNAMVESMTEGVVMTDRDYRIVVANPAVKQALGLEDKEELSIFDFIDNLEGKFDIRGKIEESIKFKRILTAREILIGERFWQIMVAPVKSHIGETKGEILGGVVIFHNITQEKALERMREDFTSMMVHELRSPLTGIKKAVEFMKGDRVREDKETYGEYVQMIHASTSEMLELVNELLDIAKIEAGKFEIHKEPSDIQPIIAERLNFFTPLAKDAKIDLRSVLDSNLPRNINLDPRRIAQVLNNFLSNALKFTAKGGTVIVQILAHEQGKSLKTEAKSAKIEWFLNKSKKDFKDLTNSIVIAVTDTGMGILKESLIDVFSKYKQLEKKPEAKGTGLGLSIAEGIVKAHGGIIGVESVEGEGSTFYFSVPI